MVNDKPLVTIGIPTFNRSDSLKKAVKSATSQDYINIEIIISDNCSTDNTEDICREYCKQFSNVRYIRNLKNVGSIRNFIATADAANGEYFMWLCDDDWIDETYISNCVECFKKIPGLSFSGGNAIYYKDSIKHHVIEHYNLCQNSAILRVIKHWNSQKKWPFYGLINKKILDDTKILDTMGADLIFIASLAFSGKMTTVQNSYIHRNLHQGGSWASLIKMYPDWRTRFPDIAIMSFAFLDIVKYNGIYKKISTIKRWSLAIVVLFNLFWLAIYRYLKYISSRTLRSLLSDKKYKLLKRWLVS